MIDIANDIQSLSEFKRKTTKFMARLKKTGAPVVLTVNGRAQVVIQDAAGYQDLVERAEKVEMLEFLTASRADIEAGRTYPAVAALKKLAKKHNLARNRQ
jgi:prevent-host-death family protein